MLHRCTRSCRRTPGNEIYPPGRHPTESRPTREELQTADQMTALSTSQNAGAVAQRVCAARLKLIIEAVTSEPLEFSLPSWPRAICRKVSLRSLLLPRPR